MKLYLLGVAVFFVSVVTDIVWARYTGYVSAGHRVKAALMAAAIIVVACFGWFAYHTTLWFVIPMALGASVGTFIGTKKVAQ